jgi:hypothetical protein
MLTSGKHWSSGVCESAMYISNGIVPFILSYKKV